MSEVCMAAPKILLIDDNPGDARLVSKVLPIATRAAKPSVACDGWEGLRFLRHEGQYATAPAPDLVLLDLRMPTRKGLEVLAEVNQYPVLRSNAVVALPGSAAPRDTHDPLPAMPGDAAQFTHLFQNLIGNAIKFHRQEPPRVHVSAELNGQEWGFSVHGNGRSWVESEPGKGAAFPLTVAVSSPNAKA